MQAFRSPHNCLVSIAIHEPGSRLPEADPYTLSFISSYSNLIAARPGNRSNRTMGCLAAYMFKLTFQKQHLGFLQIKNVNRVEGMSGLISLGLNFSGSYLKRWALEGVPFPIFDAAAWKEETTGAVSSGHVPKCGESVNRTDLVVYVITKMKEMHKQVSGDAGEVDRGWDEGTYSLSDCIGETDNGSPRWTWQVQSSSKSRVCGLAPKYLGANHVGTYLSANSEAVYPSKDTSAATSCWIRKP